MVLHKDKWSENVFLGLGSNQGNRKENLSAAREAIGRDIGMLLESSSIYETEAWGGDHLNWFYNQVVQISTPLKPLKLLEACLSIERIHGRKTKKYDQYEDRLLDIDVLFYGNHCCEENNLTLPHPHLAARNFVLIPMAEIAGEFVHPLLSKTIDELLEATSDQKKVRII